MRPALLALVLTLAGCVSAPPAEPAPNATAERGAFVDPIIEDHEHADLAAHNLSTPNMHLLGHTSLDLDGIAYTNLGEMDWHGTLGVIAAQQGAGGVGVILTVDLSDPARPTPLGFSSIGEAGHPLDVKFDEKGEFVYASGTARIMVFDVRDPTTPTRAGAAVPTGAACHMSALGVVDGTEYFFCTGDPAGLTVYQVVDAVGDARALVPVGYTRPSQTEPVQGAGTFGVVGAPHDMTFQLDPVDGTPILVVSNRGYGVRVLDVSDPKLPRELGTWTGEGAAHSPLHWHTGMVAMVNGTRYLITSPEILPDEETPPAIWILDATDYSALTLVAEWTAPGDHGSPGFTFTTHQWQIADERLYLGYYHAGVWVLDLAAILDGAHLGDPARPDVLGYYLPHEAPAVEGAMVPNVWDLTLREGVIWVTDISSGLYALHYAPDRIGDPALSGFS